MSDTEAPPEGDAYTAPASQADLDKIVEQRLARERQKFVDYDDLKAKAAKFDEVDAATKSELQKALDAVAERDAKLVELPKQVRADVLRFASLAAQKGFLDPEDALMFIDADLSDQAAVEAALTELAARKPHLVKPQTPVRKLPARPKPGAGESAGELEALAGKERAAAALRQFRNT